MASTSVDDAILGRDKAKVFENLAGWVQNASGDAADLYEEVQAKQHVSNKTSELVDEVFTQLQTLQKIMCRSLFAVEKAAEGGGEKKAAERAKASEEAEDTAIGPKDTGGNTFAEAPASDIGGTASTTEAS